MLSHKSKYALKAAIALAREFGQGPVLISDIAQRERIPRKFLELILLELRHSGILQSRKGKGGGYFLAREPNSITLGEILRVVEVLWRLCPVLVRPPTCVAANAATRTAVGSAW
jgi:Rrf2 family protein